MSKSVELMSKNGKILLYNVEKCLGCGLCVEICKNLRNAIELTYLTENLGKTETVLKVKAERCVACGWCAINCPFGALEFKINGEKVSVEHWLPQEVKVDFRRCVGCRSCVKVCPQGALDVNGKMKIVTNECTCCSFCENSCPTGAIRVDPVERKVEIDTSICIRCSACEQFCPRGLIRIRCLDCLLSIGETAYAEKISHMRVESAVKIDRDKCIYCGRCELNCPTKSIKVTKPFEGRISIKTALCPKDCTTCMNFCPCGAIERIGENLEINKDFCIYCGACYRVCPIGAIDFERKSVGIIDNRGHLVMHI